ILMLNKYIRETVNKAIAIAVMILMICLPIKRDALLYLFFNFASENCKCWLISIAPILEANTFNNGTIVIANPSLSFVLITFAGTGVTFVFSCTNSTVWLAISSTTTSIPSFGDPSTIICGMISLNCVSTVSRTS